MSDSNGIRLERRKIAFLEETDDKLVDVDVKGGKGDVRSSRALEFETAQHREGWKGSVKSNPKALAWCECHFLKCQGEKNLSDGETQAVMRFSHV